MQSKRKGSLAASLLAFAAMLAGYAPPTLAQPAPAADDESRQAAAAPAEKPKKPKLLDLLFDDTDGMLDLSDLMAGGGFVPVPVIITEPAVDGGFGIIAQFATVSKDNPKHITRRIAGGVKTGNGSHGYGYFQSGHAFDGRISYRFGVGRGKVTLDAHPRFAPEGVQYTNDYDYGVFGSALWHLPDERFSVGPMIDFRQLHSKIDFENPPAVISPDFDRTLNTGALGIGFHFDSRDNSFTPTEGVNAYVQGKFNSGAFGSDRNFEAYDLEAYAFRKLSPKWRLGLKLEVDAIRGDYPSYFAPAVDLRGVQAMRYQGSTVFSSEMELTRQLNSRWSILAFAGYGRTNSGQSRVFDDSGAIWAGGGGIRYRIARKLGIDVGVDIATGPDGRIFYLQFGHAWSFGMD